MQAAWRRIQSGYILSEQCDSACDRLVCPSKADVVSFSQCRAIRHNFCGKGSCLSRRSLHLSHQSWSKIFSEGLDPSAILEKQWRIDFLEDLSNCKHLVKRGDADSSKLVRDLCLCGRMFGSFTHHEVELIKEWVQALDKRSDSSFYLDFIGYQKSSLPGFSLGNAALAIQADSLVLLDGATEVPLLKHEMYWTNPCTLRLLIAADVLSLIPLWFTQ